MLYDISPRLTSTLPVWPGDTPLERRVLARIEDGAVSTVSTLHATVHLGAHADAPSHVGLGAASIDESDLSLYLGECQLVRAAVGARGVVLPSALESAPRAPRVLIATGTFPDPGGFREDFAALSPETIWFLADRGVRLVGIDTPSVDLFASADLPVHRACFETGVAILEGLVLDGVPEGIYELIALPLKLAGFDASPVRAVLRTRDAL
jgi:arylformamidase